MRATCLLLVAILSVIPAGSEPAHRVVYYVNGHDNWLQWWPPQQLRLSELTHVIWFQPGFSPADDPLGFISPTHEDAMRTTIRRCREAKVKILYGYAAGFETIRPPLGIRSCCGSPPPVPVATTATAESASPRNAD